jgi:hypothetical protein
MKLLIVINKPTPQHSMKKTALTVTALFALTLVHAKADDPTLSNVRPVVTVNGVKDQNKVTPDTSSATMTVENPSWGPADKKPFILVSTGKNTTAGDWKEYSFSFTPEKSGYLWLSLSGQYPPKDKPDLVFKVDFDKVVVTGGKIENGDFEDSNAEGKPQFWLFSTNAPVIPAGSKAALSGTKFVSASKDSTIGVALTGTAGQPVTVTFSARAHAE